MEHINLGTAPADATGPATPFLIPPTKAGRPVADLVPSGSSPVNARAAVDAMRSMPKVHGVSDATMAEWIAEGRR